VNGFELLLALLFLDRDLVVEIWKSGKVARSETL
jgi:hypothetical protein